MLRNNSELAHLLSGLGAGLLFVLGIWSGQHTAPRPTTVLIGFECQVPGGTVVKTGEYEEDMAPFATCPVVERYEVTN